MLTHSEVVPYLLERELISTKTVVDGDLVVADISRRNRNFEVLREEGPCYLLKQGIGQEKNTTVAREAAVYQLLRSRAANNELERYLPRFYGYYPEDNLLILELLRNAQDLRQYHRQCGRFSVTLASVIGNALSTLHRQMRVKGKQEQHSNELPAQLLPSVLTVHRPNIGTLWEFSKANIELIKIIQQFPEFCELLDELRRGWRTETLIHYDIRWDNCVVFARRGSRRKTRLKIVDWEFAGVGDPCWDIGSVFHDYLSFWLSSIPIMGEAPPDQFIELAPYPLEKMQPAIRSFWRSYAQHMELHGTTADEWLLRAVRYGATRLIQTAVENEQTSTQLMGNTLCILQLSLNIMQRPREALVHLLGIPADDW